MNAVDVLGTGIKHVDELLAEAVLEPDLARGDWGELRTRLQLVHNAVQSDVLGALDAALQEVADDEIATLMKRRVALQLAEVAGLATASGDPSEAAALLARAAELTPEPAHRAELLAAQVEPEVHARIQHARWLQEHRRHREADALLKGAARDAQRPELKQAAKRLQHTRPLESAPPLFRLNGCGVGLYGARDHRADGSYIATYCVTVLWIPVFPLCAYRVLKGDGLMYQFSTREALGPIARVWQAVVVVLAGLGLAVWGVSSFFDSSFHRARVALDEARAAEAAGDREGAIERYKSAILDFGDTSATRSAAEAVVRLTAAGVAEPVTVASVEPIGRVVNGFYDLPQGVRAGAPTTDLAKRLAAWGVQIAESKAEQASSAGLVVLDMAGKVAAGTAEAPPIDARRVELRRVLAEQVAGEKPLLALDHYTRIHDAAAVDAASKILDSFGEAPSLWIEAESQVERFTAAAAELGRGGDVDTVKRRLTAAKTAHAEDQRLIEADEEKAIETALAARPGDQELTVAVAASRRAQGDVKGAIALLDGLGPQGRLTAEARLLLASCHSDAGELERADEGLTSLVDERLFAFQAAQRALIEAESEAQRKLVNELQRGEASPELKARIEGAQGEVDQREAFQSWIRERLAADPALAALRADYERQGGVVPASLSLGTVKLRRAAEASGAARRALLDGAERAFLSIRREAAGDPGFHLGLGQVFHRLGRAQEGDAELQGVLDRKSPELSILVARAYRELGLELRAKQVAEQVYGSEAETKYKQSAASLLTHLVNDIEEQETWLRRSDTSSPEVRNSLAEIEAQKLLRSGKLAEADAAFAQVVSFYERDAKRDSVSANNAAVAYSSRYATTGDVAHVRSAVGHLEAAARLEAGNALVLGNLANSLHQLGEVTVLERWVRARVLMLSARNAATLIGAMLDSPLRGELLGALQRDPSFRRALDVGQQQQVLAPQLPAGYERQIEWLTFRDDAKGLDELAKQIEAAPPFMGEDAAADRAKWRAGEQDAVVKRAGAEELAAARDRLRRAEKAGHKPTLAAAWLTLGDALRGQAYFTLAREAIDEMVAAQRSASQAWPEGVGDRDLAAVLSRAALYKALPESPALKRAWDAEGRVYGTAMFLHRALAGPDAAEVLAALRKQPELAEAAALRKAGLGDRPSLHDWILGRAAGDSELEQAAATAFERASLGTELKLAAKLLPGQLDEQAELALYLSKGKAP